MKTIRNLITFLSVAALGVAVTYGAEDLNKLKQETGEALEAFKKADSGLSEYIGKSAGYAVFPKVSKGGLIVGGAHGNGLLYSQGKLVGRAEVSQATVGAQIGGQVFREIIFFENAAALSKFKESKFEMAAQIGAVAASEGASKDAKYREGVLVFTQAIKGLMAEASLGGQKFKFEPIAE